jgi:hypothetical protein
MQSQPEALYVQHFIQDGFQPAAQPITQPAVSSSYPPAAASHGLPESRQTDKEPNPPSDTIQSEAVHADSRTSPPPQAPKGSHSRVQSWDAQW